MKILLASDSGFLINGGYGLLGIPIEDIRIGYVTTGLKGARRISFAERHVEAMRREGYAFEEVDIEGKEGDFIFDFFVHKNIIHVEGGNAFYLLKVMREVGFAAILQKLFDQGLAYVGASAGAYVMCPDLAVPAWRQGEDRRFGLEDLTGLHYVPFDLKVHYTDDMAQDIKEKMKTLRCPLRILRDGQGILCDNGTCTFVGEGSEKVLNVRVD